MNTQQTVTASVGVGSGLANSSEFYSDDGALQKIVFRVNAERASTPMSVSDYAETPSVIGVKAKGQTERQQSVQPFVPVSSTVFASQDRQRSSHSSNASRLVRVS